MSDYPFCPKGNNPKQKPTTLKPDISPPAQSVKKEYFKFSFAYSKKEKETMDHLVNAWGSFIDMYSNDDPIDAKSAHPDDVDEFRHTIHLLQHIIATRAMRRVDPENWTHYRRKAKNLFNEV